VNRRKMYGPEMEQGGAVGDSAVCTNADRGHRMNRYNMHPRTSAEAVVRSAVLVALALASCAESLGESPAGSVDTGMGDVQPAAPALPPARPWVAEDVGLVGVAGEASQSQSAYTVKGSGGDIWGAQDGFTFLSRPLVGDGEIVAYLGALGSLNENAKAGIMFRESKAADARNAFMMVFAARADRTGIPRGKGSRLQFRNKRIDAETSYADVVPVVAADEGSDAPPLWLRLVRQGTSVTGYVSADGRSWLRDGQAIVEFPREIFVGLAVTAHDNNVLAAATFNHVRVSTLTDSRWTHAEIGTLGGYAAGNAAALQLQSAGRGFAGGEDGVTFVHLGDPSRDDKEITLKVVGLSAAPERPAKVGIMFRQHLTPESRMVAFVLERQAGKLRYLLHGRVLEHGSLVTTAVDGSPQHRGSDAGANEPALGPPGDSLSPVWLKLVRVANRFVAYFSHDGFRWTSAVDVPMAAISTNAYIGVVASSGDEGSTTVALVEDVRIRVPSPGELPPRDGGVADSSGQRPSLDGGAGAGSR
jgi:regulation of enolase protein 1 (concanavalin A-like superfamily)